MSLSQQIFDFDSYELTFEKIREYGKIIHNDDHGYDFVVFTNGCFDIIHPGHLKTLAYAKSLAGPRGAVIVGINDDNSVKRLKGNDRPVFDQVSRGKMLSSLRYVDHVITFSEDTPLKLITAIRPDIIVKGGDYLTHDIVGRDVATSVLSEYDSTWSTTKIIEMIKKIK